mgnify:CR=1 FL=1
MPKQASIQFSEETASQLAQLAEWWGEGERFTTPVVARCVDRVFVQESLRRGALDMITENESDELQEVIFKAGSAGAESFRMAGGYEVHPRGESGTDFAPDVQNWLAEHGFMRYVDTQRGPFYHRRKKG